jgi:SAM-dependent methyltransferase
VKLYTIDVDYSEFKFDRLDPYIKAGRLETIAGSSWEELDKFPDGFFSWLYIDASHHFDGVQRDLKTAKRCVRVGGHIICNDYTAWSPFEARPYGVLQAVNEFLAVEDFLVTHFALHPFGYNDIAMCKQS